MSEGTDKPIEDQPQDPTNASGEMGSEDAVDQVLAGAEATADVTVDVTAEASTDDQLAAAEDRLLRAQAETENVRKRLLRQIDDERKYAAMPLMRDLLSVVDNLDRAIEAAEKDENASGLLEGVKMVAQQLNVTLERHHCTKLEAKGQPFDPHFHEAIVQMPNADIPAGSVIEMTQAGYTLHERVVRPAQVLVSSGPPVAAEPQTESPEESSSTGE